MANHISTKKRIRSDKSKALRNRYYLKTCRSFIKKLKKVEDKTLFLKDLSVAVSKLDKLAKRNIIHKNSASRKKAALYAKYNSII